MNFIFLIIFSLFTSSFQSLEEIKQNFHKYEVIANPVIIPEESSHSPPKRSDYGTNINYKNKDSITVFVQSSHRNFILDLKLNRGLFSDSYLEIVDEDDKYLNTHPNIKETINCHYKGKLRGPDTSWATISTCADVISGVIFDGNQTYFLEHVSSVKTNQSSYYLMMSSDLKENHRHCDVSNEDDEAVNESPIGFDYNRIKRQDKIRGPAESNSRSRYVELLFVIDKIQFDKLKQDRTVTFLRYKQLANIMNMLYEPVNIYIVLVGIIIWNKSNKIAVSSDADKTLDEFLKYRFNNLIKDYPNDNAQLITGAKFSNSVVGKAVKSSMCTSKYSGGVNMDHGIIGLVAATVSHEMGHNFGLNHDKKSCKCLDNRCIMSSMSSSIYVPKLWSSCSSEHLMVSHVKLDFCLLNKPSKVLGPICGNSFLEEGEECDCGLKESCKCCNSTTCKLLSGAKCATGKCCDLDTCKIEHVAHVCRPAVAECDLPEYCNGLSEFCPDDYYVQDGTECKEGKAFCSGGQCRTHEDQCHLLWGHKRTYAKNQCFRTNTRGNAFGNCGSFSENKTYVRCHLSDVKCGMMQCISDEGQLRLSNKATKHLASITIRARKGKRIKCRSVIIDYGPFSKDPGMAPDGAKCGEDMMCLNQKCVSVDTIKFECPHNCYNAGVCNNIGNCHCNKGFEAPYCDVPGPGGSINSGPASDPTAQMLIIVYVFFLGIVPLITIAIVGYICRRRLTMLCRRVMNKTSADSCPPPQSKMCNAPKKRKPMPFHIVPTNSIRDPKSQLTQVKLISTVDRKSTKKNMVLTRPVRKSPAPCPPQPFPNIAREIPIHSNLESTSSQLYLLDNHADSGKPANAPLKPNYGKLKREQQPNFSQTKVQIEDICKLSSVSDSAHPSSQVKAKPVGLVRPNRLEPMKPPVGAVKKSELVEVLGRKFGSDKDKISNV